MTPNKTRSSSPPETGRRFRDCAALLPALGLFLLVTPVVSMVSVSGTILGLPSAIVYVFGIWAGLILLAFGLALRAKRQTLP